MQIRTKTMFHTAMMAALTLAGSVVACSSSNESNDDDDGAAGAEGGSGGQAGSKAGGAGGKAGSGGSSAGGAAGSAGGKAGSGGAAGSAGGTAGSAGGAAGSAGGTAGSGGGTGGTGGMMVVTPPEITGPGVFFSGKDMNITKLVAADAMPGYFYATSRGTSVPVQIVPVDDPALPKNTKFAALVDAPVGAFGNVILGFNFRMNKAAGGWNWFDATGYAGIQYWAKVGVPAASLNTTIVASTNLPMVAATEGGNVGTCPQATRAECPPVPGSPILPRDKWQEFLLPFSAFDSEVDLPNMGRVDNIHLAFANQGLQLWITGIKLLKADELP